MNSRQRQTMTQELNCKFREKRRAEYLSILNEPIPPRLQRLIDELKAAERINR